MRICLFLSIFIFCNCGNSRVEKLESENEYLKHKVDSMQILADKQKKIAQNMADLAKRRGNRIIDSLILVNNLKVIRVNENCGENEHMELLQTVKSIEQELIELDIEVIYNDLDECGVELHHGTRNKAIEGILKEPELKNEIERFFNIQLKLNESHSANSDKKSTS